MLIDPTWNRALKACADPARARNFLDQVLQTPAEAALAKVSHEQARILTTVFAGSQALSECLLTHPDWIHTCLDADDLRFPRRVQGLKRTVRSWLDPLNLPMEQTAALERLREFHRHEMLRIGTRDLAGLGPLPEIIQEISDIADVSVDACYRIVQAAFTERFGHPYHLDPDGRWQRTEFCIFGMGKLGGHELNYSSDIDLIFLYNDEGWVFSSPPKRGERGKGLATHQFFQRLIESLVTELTRLTAAGCLYRVDLRLRPDGDTGPLARSLAGYENYYAQWGQTWERMMLIKARCIAGDASLAAEFLEMIQPFRYPRSLPERALAEIAAMKDRIENEIVRSGELDRNVKLGRGGIREIEFVVQSLQLLQGGRLPFLQNPQTLPTLDKLAQYDLLEQSEYENLQAAYVFLRNVEHRLQMEANRQTHTIPDNPEARLRLARLMGHSDRESFDAELSRHTGRVRKLYERLVRIKQSGTDLPLPGSFSTDEAAWKNLLSRHCFTKTDQSFGVLRTFIDGPGYVHVSPRTSDLARRLTHQLLNLCPHQNDSGKMEWPEKPLSDPDRVLARLDTYLNAYGSRAMLYETWTNNPSVFELLVLLFDRSEFLAETAIRTPDLVEDLMLSGQLRRRKTAERILDDLRHGAEETDQVAWIRRYHQAEFMRLGLRDILGLVDFELNLAELSGLADACLQYALEVVMRKHRLRSAPFAIIGLGKLGGNELTYGSDLDITFVASSRRRHLHKLQKIAAEVMEVLSAQTVYGVAFQTDARLRPDGEKGLLVNTLKAYEDYYRNRAQLWEIQAISRTRTVAGDLRTGERFQNLAADLTNFREPRPDLKGYKPRWMEEIARMRARIEKERTPAGKDPLAIKTGSGGLIDAEFLAQALCLQHGWQEANTLKALQRIRAETILPAATADALVEHYRYLLRIEGVLRRWSFAGEAMLPGTPSAQYRVAVRCGYHDIESFLEAVAHHRTGLRQVYTQVFSRDGSSR